MACGGPDRSPHAQLLPKFLKEQFPGREGFIKSVVSHYCWGLKAEDGSESSEDDGHFVGSSQDTTEEWSIRWGFEHTRVQSSPSGGMTMHG